LNRNIIFALVGGLAAGFLAGYVVFGSDAKDTTVAAPVSAAPVMPAPSMGGGALPGTAPAMPSGPALPSAEIQARIARLEGAVMTSPKDHDAWVALGNEYFDSHQAQKAVEAYGKALTLKPEDPNVLTDQGVMYRQLGQFDKALAVFQKANRLQPSHVQSLFNMGIVYANDLNKPDEAAKLWNKVLTVAPASDQAAQARLMLSQLKK
jgi:cytochrome c-type biogenesis protein CcmH/NrfG